MVPMRAKRLVVAEELKHHMMLDEAMLKRLSGGEGVKIQGRHCGSAEHFGFTWQAGIVLVFNEGDVPRVDAGDAAFVERMLVVPMRSKFVKEGNVTINEDDHIYARDQSIQKSFPEWLPALADVLLDHYEPRDVLGELPSSMDEWRQDLAAADNPYAIWLEKHVVVTGDPKDVLLLSTLEAANGGGEKFTRFAKTIFNGIHGVAVVDKTSVKLGDKWGTRRGVIKGVSAKPTMPPMC